jgi:hypothetical protein
MLAALQVDLQLQVLLFLTIDEIVTMNTLSKHFNKLAMNEFIWKHLLHRDIHYSNLSVPYDIACIEHFNFRETYKNIKNHITVEELFKIGKQFFDMTPPTHDTISQALKNIAACYFRQKILDNVVPRISTQISRCRDYFIVSYKYWKETIEEIKLYDNIALASNKPTLQKFEEYVFFDTIEMAYQYVNKIKDVQQYILYLFETYKLSESQTKTLANWQCKCMEKYIVNNEWSEIQDNHVDFLQIIDGCHLSQQSELEASAYEFECISHFYQGNYGLGIESGFKSLHVEHNGYNRALRFIGKCFVKIKEFESAYDYFDQYVQKDRNRAILLELVLLHLETDSNYYNVKLARDLFQESKERQDTSSFDEAETLELIERRFKINKRMRE